MSGTIGAFHAMAAIFNELMAIKKSELYPSLWASCDELRGGMDASQYKDYVLVLLFMKYVSDKYAGQKDALLDAPKGGSFADMVAARGDKEIGDKMNKIIARLAEANNLKGVVDVADFNNEDKLGGGKEMVDRQFFAVFADDLHRQAVYRDAGLLSIWHRRCSPSPRCCRM
jgi:type I restriction-modification system DNA methylase subunit